MDYDRYIGSDPEICGGKPCVRGTRMRVRDVLGYLAAGDTVDDLLAAYPYLTRDAVLACLAFAADRTDYPIFRTAAE
jgi:uncharacterized protein (DUF433 family)